MFFSQDLEERERFRSQMNGLAIPGELASRAVENEFAESYLHARHLPKTCQPVTTSLLAGSNLYHVLRSTAHGPRTVAILSPSARHSSCAKKVVSTAAWPGRWMDAFSGRSSMARFRPAR